MVRPSESFIGLFLEAECNLEAKLAALHLGADQRLLVLAQVLQVPAGAGLVALVEHAVQAPPETAWCWHPDRPGA